VLDADGLAREQKQAIARAVGLSETAFVSRSRVADIRLEFFTPARQIAHCGHATIATFCFLRATGRIGDGARSKETIDGVRAVHVDGAMAWMEQLSPSYHDLGATAVTVQRVAASLGVEPGAFDREHPPLVVSTGNRFLLACVRDWKALSAIEADQHGIAAISDTLDLVGFYAWAPTSGELAATARMFAPRYGIAEESATGMAAGPLACYLHDRCGIAGPVMRIGQGAFMKPAAPSRLNARVVAGADGRIERVFVGGTSRFGETQRVSRS